jgi:hypothetical protein
MMGRPDARGTRRTRAGAPAPGSAAQGSSTIAATGHPDLARNQLPVHGGGHFMNNTRGIGEGREAGQVTMEENLPTRLQGTCVVRFPL